MSEERINDPIEQAPAIDPPGTTDTEQASLDAQTSVPSDGAIDPPGTT